MTKFEDLLVSKREEHGSKFDDSHLAKEFIPFFNSGARIEVEFGGEIKRGTVGVTSGWRPMFLLMLTKRSIGSSYLLDNKCKILKFIK